MQGIIQSSAVYSRVASGIENDRKPLILAAGQAQKTADHIRQAVKLSKLTAFILQKEVHP